MSQKIPSLIFAFYMAMMMACVMSLVSVAMNFGFDGSYLTKVLWAYIKTTPIAFVCIFVFRPLANYLTKKTLDLFWSS